MLRSPPFRAPAFLLDISEGTSVTALATSAT
ncbi:hypothetical protein H4V99_001535 [Cryobacterium sp. CG_9.6]|nr:hypothetical protein [Cryobacterium sp. CG_9.6]